VPLGALTLAGAVRALPSGAQTGAEQPGPRLDLPGVGLLAVALLLLTVPLVEGQNLDWPAWSGVALVASLPAFAAFLWRERRVAARAGDPLVPLQLFRRRRFAVGNLVALVFFAGNAGPRSGGAFSLGATEDRSYSYIRRRRYPRNDSRT